MAWTKERWRELGVEHSEEYLVQAIRRNLLSEEHRRLLYERNLSVEDLLNGRVEGDQSIYETVFSDWNAKLGWHEFGF